MGRAISLRRQAAGTRLRGAPDQAECPARQREAKLKKFADNCEMASTRWPKSRGDKGQGRADVPRKNGQVSRQGRALLEKSQKRSSRTGEPRDPCTDYSRFAGRSNRRRRPSQVFEPIGYTPPETTRRVRGRIGAIRSSNKNEGQPEGRKSRGLA